MMTSQSSPQQSQWPAQPTTQLTPTLALQDAAVRAGGVAVGRLLCSNLNISFAPGERWVLLGPNGAGKSTLLAAMAGLLPFAAGDAVLAKQPLKQWPLQLLARQRAWCPQFWLDPFPVSAWETVACAVAATRPEMNADDMQSTALDWLARLDASELSNTDVRILSGGERQRVALATAFAQAAPILLLDEPTSHLDWPHQITLQNTLRQWSEQGGTVIAAVHDLNFAWSLATHALLLDGRGDAVWGTREEVLTEEALSAAYRAPLSVQQENGKRWFRINLE